jgi:hypothetical protein
MAAMEHLIDVADLREKWVRFRDPGGIIFIEVFVVFILVKPTRSTTVVITELLFRVVLAQSWYCATGIPT